MREMNKRGYYESHPVNIHTSIQSTKRHSHLLVLSNTAKYIRCFCFICFLSSVCSFGYSQEATDETFPEASGIEEIKYNENYSLACHNCYETKYTSEIEEVFSYTNTIELDIWDSEIFYGFFNDWCGGKRMEKDWYIKHAPYENGNANCFKGS